MLTVAKYGSGHIRYGLEDLSTLDPYQLITLNADSFTATPLAPVFDALAQECLYRRLATALAPSQD